METVKDFIFKGSKITADGECSPEMKRLVPWKKSYDKPRKHITKQKHYLANKCPSSQSYGFSSSRVWLCIYVSESPSVVSDSLRPHGLYRSWNSPGQNTGVGSLSLFQGIFPSQGLSPGLMHCRWILYQLSHKGSPRTLEWVACPFSRGSSQSGN